MADRYQYDDPAFMQYVSSLPKEQQQHYMQAYAEDRQGSYNPQGGSASAGSQIGQTVGGLAGTAASGYVTNTMFGGAPAASAAAPAAASAAAPAASNAVAASQAAAPGAQLAAGAANPYGATQAALGLDYGTALANGTTSFATPAAAEAAGMQVVGQNANGTVMAIAPEASGTPLWSYNSPSYAGYLASAYSAYRGFDEYGDNKKLGDDYAATKAEQAAARTVGDYFTGGLASVADGALRAAAPHFMNEVDKFGNKYGAMGILSRTFGSSKDKDQLTRDIFRKQMKKNNFIDQDYNYTLADGSKFNIGADGDKMLQNMGVNIDGKSERHPYDADLSNPATGGIIGAIQPLAAIIAGSSGKNKDDVTGMLVNAAMSSGDPMQNILKMYQDAGLNHDQAYGAIHQMTQGEKPQLSAEMADAFKNGLDQTYGVGAYKKQGGMFGAAPAPGSAMPSMSSGSAIKAPSGMSAAVNPVRDPGMGTGQKPTMPRPQTGQAQAPIPQNNQPRGATANYNKPTTTPRGALSLAPKAPAVKPNVPSALVKPKNAGTGTKEFVLPPGMTYEQYLQMLNAPAAPVATRGSAPAQAPKVTPKRLGNFGSRGN